MSRLRASAYAPSLGFAARVGLGLAVAICWTAPAAAQAAGQFDLADLGAE